MKRRLHDQYFMIGNKCLNAKYLHWIYTDSVRQPRVLYPERGHNYSATMGRNYVGLSYG